LTRCDLEPPAAERATQRLGLQGLDGIDHVLRKTVDELQGGEVGVVVTIELADDFLACQPVAASPCGSPARSRPTSPDHVETCRVATCWRRTWKSQDFVRVRCSIHLMTTGSQPADGSQ